MSDALPPLSHMLLFWLPTFVLGVLVGTYQERHKESMMDFANSFRGWYDRWAPVVVTITALLAVIGIWIGTAATITNGQQDARDNAASKKVQACFDRYAQEQSASSKAVRVASEHKDIATAARDDALNREGRAFKILMRKILADTVGPKDIQRLYDTLADRDDAGRALDAAQAELDKARAENPVPDAPSEFCSVKP